MQLRKKRKFQAPGEDILILKVVKIDSIPPGAILFISSPKTVNAVFGGLMSTRAQASGAVGAVIDGRMRDLQEHRKLGFPVRVVETNHDHLQPLIYIGIRSGYWDSISL